MAFVTSTLNSKPPSLKNDTSKCLTTTITQTENDSILTKTTKSYDDAPNIETTSYSYKIWRSDVVVKNPTNVITEKKWDSIDIWSLLIVLMVHLLAIFAPFAFTWGAFWVAVFLYSVTIWIGIGVSYHRQLAHKTFKSPKWLEYFLAYIGALSLQGTPSGWVCTHRYHHQFCDLEKDPHSPIKGFWFSHVNWIYDTRIQLDRRMVKDLEMQFFYRFMRRTYMLHSFLLGGLLYHFGGFPYLVWGMGVRTVWVYHLTWANNSVGHIWGTRDWNTNDLSRNNWWLALLNFGEGWHNNHHAFDYSAKLGLEWWQIDMIGNFIEFLQVIGLAKDVKVATEIHKQRLALKKPKKLE